MAIPAERQKPSASEPSNTTHTRSEREKPERPFWPAAIEILREHNTEVLRNRVLQIADIAPHVNRDGIDKIVGIIEEAYAGEPRKYTHEAKVNHAYQVALLTTQVLGADNITHDTMAIALGHDLDEDTAHTAKQLTEMTSPRIYNGIDALSHHTNGIPIYPDEDDKRPYFEDLLEAHRANPKLQLLTIKSVDQLAVANGPLDERDLKDPKLKQRWEAMTAKKIKEMALLRSMLHPVETEIAERLGANIAFTQMRIGSTLKR